MQFQTDQRLATQHLLPSCTNSHRRILRVTFNCLLSSLILTLELENSPSVLNSMDFLAEALKLIPVVVWAGPALEHCGGRAFHYVSAFILHCSKI